MVAVTVFDMARLPSNGVKWSVPESGNFIFQFPAVRSSFESNSVYATVLRPCFAILPILPLLSPRSPRARCLSGRMRFPGGVHRAEALCFTRPGFQPENRRPRASLRHNPPGLPVFDASALAPWPIPVDLMPPRIYNASTVYPVFLRGYYEQESIFAAVFGAPDRSSFCSLGFNVNCGCGCGRSGKN